MFFFSNHTPCFSVQNSILNAIGSHEGQGNHTATNEKSKKEEKIKNRIESKLGVTGDTGITYSKIKNLKKKKR